MKKVIGKDPSVIEQVKVRVNGMARVNAMWRPIDYYGLEYADAFYSVVAERESMAMKWPEYEWVETEQYQRLVRPYQQAVDHYLTQHGTVLPYPELKVVCGSATVDQMKDYLGNVASAQGYEGWNDFHEWYRDNVLAVEPDRGIPKGSRQIWPVIITDFIDEGIQDGNHRLHQYIDMGLTHIPFLSFKNEKRKIRRVVEAWALRAERLAQYTGA